ncbi:MAG: DNA adenine methylase [Aminipila sp.]
MDSFIGWIGGKKLLRKEIINLFPKDYERYVEVFGGAGWVLFGKEYETKQLEVFNDVNSNLINIYRCIKYHCEELQRELEWLVDSREQFFYFRRQIECQIGLTDIQRAARYLYIIKYSFCNDRKSFATNSKNMSRTIELMHDVKKRLSRVVIENKDFQNLIKVYDRQGALFYLDPPYVETEKYYDGEFTLEDHIRLRDTLKNIKGKFILSYNNCEFIRNLYKEFIIVDVSRSNCMSNKEKSVFKEVIIKNY